MQQNALQVKRIQLIIIHALKNAGQFRQLNDKGRQNEKSKII